MGPRHRWSVRAPLLLLLVGVARATWSSGPYRYSGASNTEHRRNWCPQSVTKTVTCQVQNGTTLQRVYQTCRWPQGCTGGSYRTVVRPSYKIVYRTVTALEWKCCPGYTGTHCEEVLSVWQAGWGVNYVAASADIKPLCGGERLQRKHTADLQSACEGQLQHMAVLV
ncbi:hypothetical protein MHYP_G00252890 [Metynnis hypsauchen]